MQPHSVNWSVEIMKCVLPVALLTFRAPKTLQMVISNMLIKKPIHVIACWMHNLCLCSGQT